eukprot:TRINITY_DN10335_c0_g2_i1.p1 TRINITY_DN10335_c0_g2~~TRINITY_DN10335_c0_g2_i1.p1  ORF type:complete len:425 (+),score=44.71 TRINITY_DN10335_c0_g2_i1:96-1370(+)
MAKGLPLVLVANLAFSVDYSMIMPTGWQYVQELGGSHMFYGALIAAFPTGRMSLLLLVGYWSDKRGFRVPFFVVFLLSIMGGCLYGSAYALGSKWYAMLGRFLSGCGASHPLSAWAARSYTAEKRIHLEQLQRSAQLFGSIAGPTVNLFIAGLDAHTGFFILNSRTWAGYLPALISFLLMIGFLFFVSEPSDSDIQLQAHEDSILSNTSPIVRLWRSGAWVFLLIAFGTNFQIAAIDTVLAPLLSKYLGFGLTQNCIVFAGLGMVAFLSSVACLLALQCGVTAPRIITVGACTNVLGAIGCSVSMWQAPDTVNIPLFLAAASLSIFCILGYAGPAGGMYQQVGGNRQGLFNGVYTMAFAFGRPLGSILGSELLGGGPFLFCTVPVALSTIAIVAFRWKVADYTHHTRPVVCVATMNQSNSFLEY